MAIEDQRFAVAEKADEMENSSRLYVTKCGVSMEGRCTAPRRYYWESTVAVMV